MQPTYMRSVSFLGKFAAAVSAPVVAICLNSWAKPKTTSIKNEFIFYNESRDTLKLFTLFIIVKVITKLNLGHRDKFEIEF